MAKLSRLGKPFSKGSICGRELQNHYGHGRIVADRECVKVILLSLTCPNLVA